MKKILVTGGAGFIGSHLCKKLLDEGNDVLCLDNYFTGTKENISGLFKSPYFEVIRHDVCFPLYVEVDEIYNLACPASPIHYQYDPVQTTKTSVHGAINMLGLAKRIGARILQASTSEVYGVSADPIWTEESKSLIGPPTKLRWSYAASKLIDEFLALSEHNDGNLNPIIVRLFNIIGPNQLSEFGMVVPKFIEAALKNEPIIIHGEGNQTRSFTWVGDVVNYFYLLAQKGLYGEIFNIGQTEEISIKDLAEMVIKQTNSNSEVIFKTHEEVYGNKFEDPMRRTPSIEKIINATGYEPTMTIPDMIKEIINYKT